MQAPKKHRGSFFLNMLIFSFSVAVAVLSFWLLGYLLRDIDRIEGPNFEQMVEAGVPAELNAARDQIAAEMKDLNRQLESSQERRRLTNQTTNDSQQTINQLLELKRLATEQNQPLNDEQQAALTDNLQLFLANQREIQTLNSELIRLQDELEAALLRKEANQAALQAATVPIRSEYTRLAKRHQWQLAAAKLAMLIPLLIICVWLAIRQSGGTYAMLIYAISAATATRVLLVMHEHFPAVYFKYILILLSLAICVVVLVRLLRLSARPSSNWLLRQYREAYATFFCPICDYPIQRGPLQFAYWTRRSLKKSSLSAAAKECSIDNTAYVCPSCATSLYDPCEQCGKIRHSLLPACEHCGKQREITSE
ncbi:hypothetical protein SH139x_003549 [Planctomycetaceae bacterium SH139]